MNLKKELSGVAEIAAQIMGEQLKGQQHKIDANKNCQTTPPTKGANTPDALSSKPTILI